jgi:hypothetical protein
LRRLRDRVEAQELKLRKLRALRGQVDQNKLNNASLSKIIITIIIMLRAGRPEDRIPLWARFSAHAWTGPGAHPASYTMGTGCFSRG